MRKIVITAVRTVAFAVGANLDWARRRGLVSSSHGAGVQDCTSKKTVKALRDPTSQVAAGKTRGTVGGRHWLDRCLFLPAWGPKGRGGAVGRKVDIRDRMRTRISYRRGQ